MKKLIAMIGAVATAFGLYAATPFATSFETRDEGISEGKFTPGEGWTWASSDALTLGVYADDAYTYGTGALGRRDEKFTDTDNLNYLKLETGTNALTRAVDGNVFLDQLVKFTGFEEYQTNLVAGTKIAVWMSGIEAEGTPQIGTPQIGTPAQGVEGEEDYVPASPDYQPASEDYQPASDDYIAGETNLYITCAKVAGGKVEPIALKIAGDYKLDTWYRLTIKSLGSIYGEEPTDAERAGFIVYIDGQQVAAVGDEAKTLIQYASEMTSTAKGYMAEGALFPAIDTENATFETVGYQGIGAIDDIILDEEGPAFAQAIDVKIEFLKPGVEGDPTIEVDYIDVGGVHMGYPLAVPAGTEIIVHFKPVAGKKIMSQLDPITLTVTANNYTIDVSDVIAEDVVAKKNGTIDLAASEMADALAALVENDTIAFVADCSVYDSSEAPLYDFSSDTLITATENGWDVFVGADGACTFVVYADVENVINVEFEDGENGQFGFSGTAINGQLIVENGTAMTMAAVTVGNGALLKAAYLQAGDAITLAGTGKVITATDPTELAGSIVDGESVEVIPTENDPEEGWYTYALATEPEKTGFAIIIAEDNIKYFDTLEEAIEAAGSIVDDVQLPSVVTILEDFEVTKLVEVNKAVTIDLNGNEITAKDPAGCFLFKDNANGFTLKNGTINADLAEAGNGEMIMAYDAGGTIKDLVVSSANYLVGVGASTASEAGAAIMATPSPYTLVCTNVTVAGGSNLFYTDWVNMQLIDCGATQSGTASKEWYNCAINADYGATLTVDGGVYSAKYVLNANSSPAAIFVTDGEFTGEIKDWGISSAYEQYGDHDWEITGGKFSVDPKDFLADGYAATLEEGWYSVAQSLDPVATVTLAGGEPVEYTDLHKALVDGSVAGAVVELIDNVDLAGKNWEPIVNFAGTFDGAGHKISNLLISCDDSGDQKLGLFSNIPVNTVIKNFTVENATVYAPKANYIGVVAGSGGGTAEGKANGLITNVTVCGSIQVTGNGYVGVICGHGNYGWFSDCHVDGGSAATSFVKGNSSSDGGIFGMAGEGTSVRVYDCSVKNISISGTSNVGAVVGRQHYGEKIVNCTAENCILTCNTAEKVGGIAGDMQNNGSHVSYAINCSASNVKMYWTNGTEITYRDFGNPETKQIAVSTDADGDLSLAAKKLNLTAGTFTLYNEAALTVANNGLAAQCAAGYEPVANQDGTYTIMQVFPIEVVNAGEKATVAIDQTGSVIPGAKITGTVSGVAEGFKAFVFVDGVKATVDNEGKFEGTATASAKIAVAYAKDSAWYLNPFVKNDGEVVKKMDFGVDRMGDIVLSADGSKLYSAPGWQNYIACDGGYTGLLQFNVPLISSYVGSYFKIENGQLGSSGEDTSINSIYEAFRSIVPVGNDYVVIGQTRGAEIRHQDYPGMSAQSSIYPIGGDWGDTKFGGTTDGDSRYVCYSDINMGTAVTAAADPTLLQWHTAGVVSSDGKYLYLAQYARNEIVKLALSKDTEGKAVWTKTGIWWHTKDEDIFNGNACNALALLPTANGDVVFASLSDGRLVKLNETTLSGNTFVDHHEGATAKVADYKMDLVANLGTIRAMKVTGVADGLPHLQVFKFDKANSALMIYALTADGDLVSTTPIATYQGGNAQITNGYYQNVVSSDDETIAFAHYEDKPDRSNYSCVQNYRMAVLTAKPEQVTIRTTFGTYEEGTDTMVDYGTDAKVAIAPAAGCTITSVKVNGEPLLGFNPAGFDFEEAAIARNVYIEMTIGIDPAQAVAQIDGKYFLSLIDALNAAEAGDTVVMLKDASYVKAYEFGVTLTKDVTLDLNGKLVTIDGSDHYSLTIKDGATLTITDSSEDGNGELRDIGYMSPFILVTETGATGSHLVLNRGKITNTCKTYNNRLIRIDDDNDAGSSFTMNGGEISSPSAASKTIESWYYAEATITGGKVVGVLSDNHGADDSAKWGTITIPATSTALFDRDQTAFCAEGYVTDEHGENEGDLAGWWFVTAGPTYAITYDYGAGTAPETANKAAFAAYAADRTFTLTKPTSDAEFEAWTADNELITFAGDVMTIPADFNEAFTVTATYKATGGEVAPGGAPVVVDTAEAASNLTIKATAPADSGVTDANYVKYFKKSVVTREDGKFVVTAVLDEKAIEFEESVEDLGEQVSQIAAGAEEVTIAAKPGLFYYVEEASDVTKIAEPARDRVMATGATVTVPTTKFEKSGFYRLKCSTVQRGTVQD